MTRPHTGNPATCAARFRQLLHGGLNPQRSAELIDEMRAAGLPL